jgi:branched-chain amino acid aminotransferase
VTALVWAAGRIRPADEPVLRADDHGLVVGDGVFETVKVVDRRPFALCRHLDRLERSARGLGLLFDRDAAFAAISVLLTSAQAPAGRARLRVILTGGASPLSSERGNGSPTFLAAVEPSGAPAPDARVVVVPWTRNERAATAGLKTTSYAENVVALAYAHQRGGTEALFTNTRGHVCEGTGSNIFVAVDGRLVTPPLSSGCLAGVTRALLLEWLPGATEADLLPGQLAGATEAFLCSTMRDVQAVSAVDGRPVRWPGPLTERARAVFAERSAADLDP